MSKSKKQAKPLSAWRVSDHFMHQLQVKAFLPKEYKLIVEAPEADLMKVRMHDDKCTRCKHFKFQIFLKQTPQQVRDLKIVGCQNCGELITVYLNERSHGNTPIHSYQTITQYLGTPCEKGCGYRPLIVKGMTEKDIAEKAKHDCTAWATRKQQF